MDPTINRRARREALAINREDVVSAGKGNTTMIVSPAITRRPQIDAMLGDMAIISKMELERLRNKSLDGQFLDKDERRAFKELCETVLRQARVEMEVEDHVSKRMTATSIDQLRQTLMTALQDANVDTEVVALVLDALGMTTQIAE